MNFQGHLNRLKQEIAGLPAGTVVSKTANGRKKYYYRTVADGKRTEKMISAAKADEMRNLLLLRKKLTAIVSGMDTSFSTSAQAKFRTNVMTGDALNAFAAPAKNYRQSLGYDTLESYVNGQAEGKVFVLYGQRRSGRTTLLRQVLLNMRDDDKAKTACIVIEEKNTVKDILADIETLKELGFSTIFMDEVTSCADLMCGSAQFAKNASDGIRLILSGEESLGAAVSESTDLKNSVMYHSVFVSYRERHF